MSGIVADIFRRVAELNAEDPRRQGNVVSIPPDREVVVVGDIHGSRDALAKVIGYANRLPADRRCLVLQELIHGAIDPDTGHDRSIELILRTARIKLSQPDQIVFLMGNHDVAQLTGNEITKDGQPCCETFRAGVEFLFGDQAGQIMAAFAEMIESLPLAVRCPNGVLVSHSLPSPGRMDSAGVEILDRPYRREDFARGGGVYEWTWGRGQTPEQLDQLREMLGVRFFILGHRHTAQGCEAIAPGAWTVASDHAHGCMVHFRSDQEIDPEEFAKLVRPIVAI